MPFDPVTLLLRTSKLRIGGVRAQGLPAIFLGIAGIVIAAGAARSLRQLAPQLPETLRELTALIEATRPNPKIIEP
jgi:hypothetical protein